MKVILILPLISPIVLCQLVIRLDNSPIISKTYQVSASIIPIPIPYPVPASTTAPQVIYVERDDYDDDRQYPPARPPPPPRPPRPPPSPRRPPYSAGCNCNNGGPCNDRQIQFLNYNVAIPAGCYDSDINYLIDQIQFGLGALQPDAYDMFRTGYVASGLRTSLPQCCLRETRQRVPDRRVIACCRRVAATYVGDFSKRSDVCCKRFPNEYRGGQGRPGDCGRYDCDRRRDYDRRDYPYYDQRGRPALMKQANTFESKLNDMLTPIKEQIGAQKSTICGGNGEKSCKLLQEGAQDQLEVINRLDAFVTNLTKIPSMMRCNLGDCSNATIPLNLEVAPK